MTMPTGSDKSNDRRRVGRRALVPALAAMLLAAAGGFASGGSAAADGAPDKALIENGRQVFMTAAGVGCAACHGQYADGSIGVGPNNRGMNEAKIRAALASVPAMKPIGQQLSDAQIKQVAAYVEWLGQMKLVKTIVKRGHFVPERVEIYPGTKIQLAINNASIESHKFSSDNMKIATIAAKPRQDLDLIWEAPRAEGTFTLVCVDCEPQDRLTIAVTAKAPKFLPARTVQAR